MSAAAAAIASKVFERTHQRPGRKHLDLDATAGRGADRLRGAENSVRHSGAVSGTANMSTGPDGRPG